MTVPLPVGASGANHLIIPYAASRSPALQGALKQLELPHLQALLQALTRVNTDVDNLDQPGLNMPHERAWAQALQLPGTEDTWPWAALANSDTTDQPQAYFSPCHWQIGIGQVVMLNPASLQVVQGWLEPSLASVASEQRFQIERHGYFITDRKEHAPGAPVLNRVTGLKDSWGR